MNIKISNLCFKYDKKSKENTLSDINLDIKSGTINVLLGLNGSGKTTLLKLLAGLEKANEGTIEYGEREINSISIKDRSKIFAYVPQHSNVTADIPVFDYLTFGTANTLNFYESPKKEQFDLVDKIAERLNIKHLLKKNIGEISGGERQIVLIACALIQSTPVILLDEPTSALDIKNQHLVLSTLKEIISEGKTIILSSHNPNHSLYLNSNAILINKGIIKEEGPAKELICVDKLREIYGDAVCVSKDLDYDEITFKD